MFSENEYEILNEITKQKNSKLLYIITHSSEKTDKEEIIEMINVGIKSFLEKSRIDNYFEIFSKIKTINDNCIFVNFRSDENDPIYRIDELQ